MRHRSSWIRLAAAGAALWLAGCGAMESAADDERMPRPAETETGPEQAHEGKELLRCGPFLCDPRTQFCSIEDWSPDSRPTYSCLALPEACRSMQDPDCSCIPILLDCPCEEVREDQFVRRCSREL
jgi:hypothetical protein